MKKNPIKKKISSDLGAQRGCYFLSSPDSTLLCSVSIFRWCLNLCQRRPQGSRAAHIYCWWEFR